MVPGWETTTIPATIQNWFDQLQANPLLGLRNLDLLNIVISFIQIPMFLALFGVYRKESQAFAILALIVWLMGISLFISNNAALPMFDLSTRYSDISTEFQRAAIEGAGIALLARGAHGSIGSFMGFFLSSIGTLLFGLLMLRGKLFSRFAAWVGIVGITLLIIYTIGNTFVPNRGNEMLIIAMPGGILMIVWNILIAKKLFQLVSDSRE
jgi:hypothetical protein